MTNLPHLAAYIEDLGIPDTKAEAILQRDMWVESAAQFHRNEEYYRDLLDRIAVIIGGAAYVADDGSISDSPLRAKLPELVFTLSGASEVVESEGARYRHVKRGTCYTVIGAAELQMSEDVVDGTDLVIYRGDDGKLWARADHEFHDGRFEPLSPPPRLDGEREDGK